jgi:phage-related protein
VSTVSEWIGKAVAKVKELPGKAKSALGSLGSTLMNAGKELIKGFISGISSMFGSVKSKLGDLTSKLTDWKGPLPKDKVLLYNAGVVIIKGLIKGLESQYDNVKKSLEGLTALIGKAKLSKGLTAKLKADQAQLNTLLSSWDSSKQGRRRQEEPRGPQGGEGRLRGKHRPEDRRRRQRHAHGRRLQGDHRAAHAGSGPGEALR